jgi:trehalose-6-phosphate synthase
MNLTSYEFIACQQEKKSPLILSEFCGSVRSLSGGKY